MAAAIEALVALDDAEDAAFMRGFSETTLRNWNGIEVGALRASAVVARRAGSRSSAALTGRRSVRPRAAAAPRASASVSASCSGLSARMRSMRGKRTAMPLLWRALRLMPSKPSSNTSVGLTLRTGPNFSSVVRRIDAIDLAELLVGQARVRLGERDELQRLGRGGSRAAIASIDRLRLGGIGGVRFQTANV